MRESTDIVHSRARTGGRYALLPLEGYPASRLPGWEGCEVRVLASPTLGAGFVQMLIDLPAGAAGGFAVDDGVETFYYVLNGGGALNVEREGEHVMRLGAYGLVPPGQTLRITAAAAAVRLLVLRKRYEPCGDYPEARGYHGHADDVPAEVWGGNPASRLQTLLPEDPAFDLAMNIFTFDPGAGLPVVETHVMEHGLLFLDGRGLYYLDGEWMEVQRDDFIWMGPYCPQSFVGTGPTPSRYIYYKNVNRDIPL